MGFALPDLILESVIREGLAYVRSNPAIIDDIMSNMKNLGPMIAKKYGDREIEKIKKLFTDPEKKEISVVFSFAHVTTNLPCISIQLESDVEAIKFTTLDDFVGDEQTPIEDPEELAKLVITDDLVATGYDPKSRTVYFANTADLSGVNPGNQLVDAAGTPFIIEGGIVDLDDQKQVVLASKEIPDISDFLLIRSGVTYTQNERRGVPADEKILLGIHAEDRLTAIYLYYLVKYFILSRKKTLIERGFKLATFQGSDFTRNLEYVEPVYSRFLTIGGLVQDDWISDQVTPVEIIDTKFMVPKDQLTNEELGRTNQTIQVNDDE